MFDPTTPSPSVHEQHSDYSVISEPMPDGAAEMFAERDALITDPTDAELDAEYTRLQAEGFFNEPTIVDAFVGGLLLARA